MWESLLGVLLEPGNRGKILGVTLGLFFGILAAIFGIWKTLFIAICIFIGYIIGKRIDEQGDFRNLLDKMINRD
ncbi:MAG: DUF2273 domain-containing protein [Clostridia bacterium]|jgi:uncharacterized membrane protein|nr:DUF2273 domain-containing protein [Clostridia bacterium]